LLVAPEHPDKVMPVAADTIGQLALAVAVAVVLAELDATLARVILHQAAMVETAELGHQAHWQMEPRQHTPAGEVVEHKVILDP